MFLPNRPVIFLLHGWDSWPSYWAEPVKDEMMTYYNGNANIVLVNWKDGANHTYPLARV